MFGTVFVVFCAVWNAGPDGVEAQHQCYHCFNSLEQPELAGGVKYRVPDQNNIPENEPIYTAACWKDIDNVPIHECRDGCYFAVGIFKLQNGSDIQKGLHNHITSASFKDGSTHGVARMCLENAPAKTGRPAPPEGKCIADKVTMPNGLEGHFFMCGCHGDKCNGALELEEVAKTISCTAKHVQKPPASLDDGTFETVPINNTHECVVACNENAKCQSAKFTKGDEPTCTFSTQDVPCTEEHPTEFSDDLAHDLVADSAWFSCFSGTCTSNGNHVSIFDDSHSNEFLYDEYVKEHVQTGREAAGNCDDASEDKNPTFCQQVLEDNGKQMCDWRNMAKYCPSTCC